MSGKLEPAEVFHEFLEHRWFLSEKAGREVDFDEALQDYIGNVLAHRPDEQSVLDPDLMGNGLDALRGHRGPPGRRGGRPVSGWRAA